MRPGFKKFLIAAITIAGTAIAILVGGPAAKSILVGTEATVNIIEAIPEKHAETETAPPGEETAPPALPDADAVDPAADEAVAPTVIPLGEEVDAADLATPATTP